MLKPWCVRYQENIIQIYILWVIISKINYSTKRGNTCQKQLDLTWSTVQKAHSSYKTFYASILSIIFRNSYTKACIEYRIERYFIATKTMKIHYSKHEKYHTFHFHSFLLQMFPWMHKIERFAFEKLKLFSLLNEFDLGRNWKIGDNFYQHARINKFQILNLRKKFKRKWI